MIFIDMLCSQYDLNLRIISLFEVVGEVGTLLRTEISALDNNVGLAVYMQKHQKGFPVLWFYTTNIVFFSV